MFISPYSNLASVSCTCSGGKGSSQRASPLSQGPSRQTSQAASCSHQQSRVLLNALKVLLSELCSLKTSLKLRLLDSQLPAQLIKLLLIVNSHLDGGSEVLVKLFNGDLVVEAGVLNNLDGLEDLVSILGGDSKLGDCVAESVSCLLVFLLHQHDSTGESGNISLNLLVLLVSLLKRL